MRQFAIKDNTWLCELRGRASRKHRIHQFRDVNWDATNVWESLEKYFILNLCTCELGTRIVLFKMAPHASRVYDRALKESIVNGFGWRYKKRHTFCFVCCVDHAPNCIIYDHIEPCAAPATIGGFWVSSDVLLSHPVAIRHYLAIFRMFPVSSPTSDVGTPIIIALLPFAYLCMSR